MQSTELFKVYSSSAGSGKTFTLAKEYIKLLLMHSEPFYFKKILAVTFTNDAANEMKVRILEFLNLLANPEDLDEKKLDKRSQILNACLADFKKMNLDFSENLIRLRAKEAFSYIIHHYSDFSVSTIDSFIQKIVSAFAIQLGYLNNIEIILDAEEILLTAAENFIAKVGDETEASLSDAIIDYVNQLAEEGKSWNNLPKSFSDFAKSLFSDSKLKYLEKIEDLSIESIKEISMQIFDYLRDTESNIKEITDSFIDLCFKNGLDAGDFLLGSRASILAVMLKRNAGVDIFKEFSKTVLKVHQGEWYAKTAPNKAIIDGIKSELYEIFYNYESIIETESPKYILLKAIHQHLFKLSLLRQFKIEIEQIKSDNGYVHISEFNKAILNVVSNEPVPYIYERIGEKYNHIMIDEFQDTSPIQFQNFLPLFANSLANSKSCMIVGDPKQAIYRFRGGDMTQIIHLYNQNIEVLKSELNPESFLIDNLDEIKPHLKDESLQVNYRSFSEIIDFNNDLFSFIRNHKDFQEEFPLLEKAFDKSFIQEKQENVKTGATIQIVFKNEVETADLEISVSHEFTENSENFDDESVSNLAKFEGPQILKTIHKSLADGFALNDIAILCRRKIVAKGIANYLKNNEIPIISSDSILLSFSNSINFVMDLLEITTANNQMIRYQSLCHFHKFILNGEIPPNEGIIRELVENEDILPLFSYFNSFGFSIDSQLVTSYSLYELAEYLIYSFRLLENKSEQEYLFAFLDEIISFKARKSNSVHEFIEFWKLNKSKLSINSKNRNAVTITTIHKSKGLQYPIVLVPEATWAFKMLHFDSIWVHLDGVDYQEFSLKNTQDSLKIATLNPKKELNQTLIKQQFNAEEELYFLEAINMLYVATTRAVERLYIFTKHTISQKKIAEIKAKKLQISESCSIQNIGDIFCHFLDSQGKFDFDRSEYILKEGLITKNVKIEEIKVAEPIFLNNYNFEKTSQLRVSNGKLNALDSEFYLEKGNKIHKILADILTKSDIEIAVNKAITIGEISFDEKNLFENNLKNLVNLPDLSQYFEEGVNAKNEMEILLPDGNSYRPDRVNFAQNETTIIDYKTGHERPEYSSQLRHYGNLLTEMGFPATKKMLVYLNDLKVVEVN